MSRAQAVEQMEKALSLLDTARPMGPTSVSAHFVAQAQAHALVGVLAALAEDARPALAEDARPALAEDARPALAEVLTSVGSILISSDCRDDKHRACAGAGWDDAANRVVDCPCECHA